MDQIVGETVVIIDQKKHLSAFIASLRKLRVIARDCQAIHPPEASKGQGPTNRRKQD
jgi:hypothetical protein